MFLSLLKRSRWALTAAMVASVGAGLFSVLLVTQINAALTAEAALRRELAVHFAITVVGVLIFDLVAHILFQRLRHRGMADLRLHVAECVMNVPYRKVEQVGAACIQVALTDHVTDLSQLFVSLPIILMNSVVVTGCLIYLAALTPDVFLVKNVVLLLGSIGYTLAHSRAMQHLRAASVAQDRLFGYFRSLTDGAKELRQNLARRTRFLSEALGQTLEQIRRERTHGTTLFEAAAGWGNFLVYAFIGLVLFVLAGPDKPK